MEGTELFTWGTLGWRQNAPLIVTTNKVYFDATDLTCEIVFTTSEIVVFGN